MATHPNFILLVGEDVGLHLGCYGQGYAATPHLDGLAAAGQRYSNAISTAPVCSPSRASIATGMYPWSIGVHHHRSQLLNPPRTLTHDLRDAGYYANWQGKQDFNFTPAAGFSDTPRDWLPGLAKSNLPDRPFFLYRNFGVTHESTMWRMHPTGGAYEERIANQHRLASTQQHDPRHAPVPKYLAACDEVRGDIARYFDALSIADAMVGDVLSALQASRYRDNTYVIFMSDHGRGLLREKRWCYEAGVHLPLIIAGPGIPAGRQINNVVNWVDIAPTILSLAGVSIDERYHGVPFLGPNAQPRKYAFAGRGRMDETYDCQRAARNDRWLYVRNGSPQLPYAQHNIYQNIQLTTQTMYELNARGLLRGDEATFFADRKPPEELYDTQADFDCVRNMVDDPRCGDVLNELRQAMDKHLSEVGDLGAVPERQLIDRGLVADVLPKMDERRFDAPAQFTIGGASRCALEMPEENRPKP